MGWFSIRMSESRRMPEIRHLLFLLILAVAVFLRFYRISDIPFTQDEQSAIFRTDYTSFSDLIEYGVKPDGHPAGIQLLLFVLIRFFGVSGIWLKIPFLLFGLFSILFAYRIARVWFNDTVALLTTSLLAVLQYTIYYSQIARPYMSGMFFSLWMVWCWTQFIINPGKSDLKNLIGLVLATICCAYNHHFSMLFAGIVWLTGLFLIDKKRLIYYFLGALLTLLAYLPHLPVLLHQMKMKGVEDWLAKPGIFFITDYFAYLFHFSPLFMLVNGAIALAGLFLHSKKTQGKPPFRVIALVWFLIPLATGLMYSLFVSAVLQYSVLIFAFPFLLMLLFSFYPEIKAARITLPVLAILITGTLTLFLNRHHYGLFYGSGPGTIIQETADHVEQYGSDRVSIVFHAGRRSIDYTLSSMQVELPGEIFYIEDSTTFPRFTEYLSMLQADYLVYAWTAPLDIEYKELVKEYFPYHLEWKKSFLTEFHLFSRMEDSGHITQKKWSEGTGFEPGEELFDYRTDHIIDTLSATGEQCYRIDSITSYGPSYLLDLNGMDLERNDYITVTLSLFLTDPGSDPILVGSIDSDKGELMWRGNASCDFLHGSGQWGKVYLSMRLPQEILREKNLVFKTFLRNRDRADCYIDNFEVAVHAGNQNLYGLFEAID